MPDIFIGYGGPRAERVADDLHAFLRSETLDTFCVSPRSLSGYAGYSIQQIKQLILKNIEGSAVVVLVCHDECSTAPFIEEIDYINRRELNSKVIVYSKCDDCIPESARDLWHPTHFAPEKYEESFSRLLNQILKKMIRSMPTANVSSPATGAQTI